MLEVQSHGREQEGLGELTDPRAAELQMLMQNGLPAATPDEAWDMCLRGNFNIYKYNAINVDKWDSAPTREYYLRRIDLSCGAPPPQVAFPIQPEEPTYPCLLLGIPMILKQPGDIPLEKLPPRHPGNPGGGDDPDNPFQPPPNGPRPLPPGSGSDLISPFPAPGEPDDAASPSNTGEPSSGPSPSTPPTPGCPPDDPTEILNQIAAKYAEVDAAYSNALARYNRDVQTFNDNFKWGWPEAGTEVQFEDPELQSLYESFLAQVEAKRRVIQDLLDMIRQDRQAIEAKKMECGTLVLMAAGLRASMWENMITVGGEWSQVSINCVPAFVPSGGIPANQVVVVTEEMQRQFQSDLYGALMNGATWDEAVETAVTAAPGDAIMKTIWRGYAQCLKKLAVRQLRIFLAMYLPPEDVETGIRIMFEGESALSPEQAECLRQLRELVEGLRPQWEAQRATIRDCERQIHDLWIQFYQAVQARNAAARQTHRDFDQKLYILEAFMAYLRNGGFDLDNPDDPAAPRYLTHEAFCRLLRMLLVDPECASIPCIPEYLQTLIDVNCPD